MSNAEILGQKCKALRLTAYEEFKEEIHSREGFAEHLLEYLKWEEEVRWCRKLRRRSRASRLHKYRKDVPLTEFDWEWPTKFEGREEFRNLFTFEFLKTPENVVLIGTSGLGKTALLKNLVQEAVNHGHEAVYIEAAELLDELAGAESRASRRRMLERYAKCELLGIDELGYLSYESEHADLLFQVIQKRSGRGSTALTTNRDFGEWSKMFPNPGTVNALLDRLIEKCTTVRLEGESYRTKIQKEHAAQKKQILPAKKE